MHKFLASLITVLLFFIVLGVSTPLYAHDCLAKSERTDAQSSVFKKLNKKAKKSCRDADSPKSCRNKKLKRACSTTLKSNGDAKGKDSDLDKVNKKKDNCPVDENADQLDTDSDTIGDVCDNAPNDSNVAQLDTDNDTIGDAGDNCPNKENADQADADEDGTGDICEVCDVVLGGLCENTNCGLFIFKDVLNSGSFQTASVSIVNDSNYTASLYPVRSDYENNILATINRGGEVHIWGDYSNMSNQQEPDVVLDNATSGINNSFDVVLHMGDLYVSSTNNSSIRIFRNISTAIVGGVAVAPDVVLDMGTSGVNEPNGIEIDENGRLWVANFGNNTVTAYDNADAITVVVAPSIVLTSSAMESY